MAETHPIVALWAVPRSVSTAFERMVAARGDFKVFNEPFSGHFYFGGGRFDDRYREPPDEPPCPPQDVVARMQAAAATEAVFFKDMAYHVQDVLSTQFLASFTNTVLIRHPGRSLPSLYKKLPEFTLEETGFSWLEQLVDLTTELTGSPPAVIDGEALRREPEKTVRAWCAAVGVPFRPEALQWSPGHEPHWQHWQRWYQEAAQSQGFVAAEAPLDDAALKTPHVAAAYEQCLPIYERLAQHRIA